MKKSFKAPLALLLIGIILITSLSACGKKSYVGEWSGNDGSFLQLNKDGSCLYVYKGSKSGTWEIKKKTLYVTFGSYHLYADLSQSQNGFLLKGDNYWIDEFFTKLK
ncbi:MAG: hypothetical protein IJU56_08960 [Clostridia bacterium]|nr:hypothetical protein [Clostridia bacterium]